MIHILLFSVIFFIENKSLDICYSQTVRIYWSFSTEVYLESSTH